ncbi:hypothetical protein ABC374_16760 [Peribacillus sp. 1P06PB]
MFTFLLILYFFYLLKFKKIKISNLKVDILNVCFLGILIIYFFVGIFNSSFDFIFGDIRVLIYYCLPFLLYYFLKSNKDDNLLVIKTLIISSILFSIITIGLFYFSDTLFKGFMASTQWEGAKRLSFTNSLMVVILMPVAFNKQIAQIEGKWIFYLRFSIVMLLFTILLSKSINTIVIVFFVFLVLINLEVFKKKKKKNTLIKIVMLAFTIGIFFLFLNSFSGENRFSNTLISDTNNKLKIALTNPDELNSWQSRIITNSVAIEEFYDNKWGYGLGKTFQTFIQNGELAQLNSLYIDNAIITIINKIGILGAFVFFSFLIVTLLVMLHYARISEKRNKSILYGFCVSYVGILLSMISTAHIFVNPIIISLVCLIYYLAYVQYKLSKN